MTKEAVLEAIKEAARVCLLALVSYYLTKLTQLPQTTGTVIGLAILKWFDKFIHENQKDKGVEGWNGLVGF